MKLRGGQALAKRSIGYLNIFKISFHLCNGRAFTEQGRNKLILGDIVFSVDGLAVKSVSDKVQTRRAKSLFVCRVVKQRVAVHNVSRSDQRKMRSRIPYRKISGNNNDAFAVAVFIIEISAEIVTFRLKIYCGTHNAHTSFCPNGAGDARSGLAFFIFL